MTKAMKEKLSQYQDYQILKDHLAQLKGQKFKLECGHHITIGSTIYGIAFTNQNTVICSLCSY